MVLYTPGNTSGYPNEKVKSGIRFYFLGGAEEVGNVGCVIEDNTGTRLLIDYGMAQLGHLDIHQKAPGI